MNPPSDDVYDEANRTWWDAVLPIHEASRGYDRDGFVRGSTRLCRVELGELGPRVRGKKLLHLQCHFGIDTLSWARLGAEVTGLDFSGPAIEAARRLSTESGVRGRFVRADVHGAVAALEGETFDIVYTGIGALCWLPDVRRWASIVAACLRPGGLLYLYEGHPVLWSLDIERGDRLLVLRDRYFEHREPTPYDGDTTYVEGPTLERRRTYQWNHGLGEILTAILDAGLRVEFVHEHRDVPWQALPWMEPCEDEHAADGIRATRMWRLPEGQRDLAPLMYSLAATKTR